MASPSEHRPHVEHLVHEIDRPEPFRLRDGRTVVLRRIRPDDATALMRGFRELSPETVRLRFFAPLRELNPQFALRLADVDFVDRAAFVATLPGCDRVVAVGRYDRIGPATAEVAFVTLDRLQGQGIASHMFWHLVQLARRNHIQRFVATVLPENQTVLRMLRATGFPMRTRRSGSIVEVELEMAQRESAAGA